MAPDPRHVTWHHSHVTPDLRAARLGQRGAAIWLTGLSGSGKSTVAMALERRLVEAGRIAYVLDGDNVRHGLCGDLGFGEADRRENIRRVGHVARLFVDAGVIVAAAFISPFRADRDAARALVPPGQFFEVHVATPIEVCEARDPKGLYRKARAGQIADFTGISAPYEPPFAAELTLDTAARSVDECVDALIARLGEAGILQR
jgi:adenylylsulfate kinase